MKHSDSLVHFAPALVAAQVDLKGIGKDAKNPEFRSDYATLDHVIASVRPVLARHGLALVQSADESDTTRLIVETVLIHSSGEWLSSTVVVPLVGRMQKGGGRAEPDPQSGGSALSYGKRYGLTTILVLSTGEDDDGNAASHSAAGKSSSNGPRRAPANPPNGDGGTAPATPSASATPSAEIRMSGKPLGDYSTEDLNKMIAKRKNDPTFAKLVDGARQVLTSRSLGESDDARVERAKAAVAAEDSDLPF